MTSYATSLPPMSKEAFDKMDQAFPPVTPEPNVTTLEELMYASGSRAVVEWCRVHLVRESTIVRADVTNLNVRAR